MSEITYTHHGSNEATKVYLEKKHIGNIENVDGGFQYFPKCSTNGGDIFKSIIDCMECLEN